MRRGKTSNLSLKYVLKQLFRTDVKKTKQIELFPETVESCGDVV